MFCNGLDFSLFSTSVLKMWNYLLTCGILYVGTHLSYIDYIWLNKCEKAGVIRGAYSIYDSLPKSFGTLKMFL